MTKYEFIMHFAIAHTKRYEWIDDLVKDAETLWNRLHEVDAVRRLEDDRLRKRVR